MGVRRDEDEGEHARVSALPSSAPRELSEPRDDVLVPSSCTQSAPWCLEPTRGVVKRKAWSATAVFCLGSSARVCARRRRYTSAAAAATASTADAIAPARAGVGKPCLWDGLAALGAGSGDEGLLLVTVDGGCWLVLGGFVQTGDSEIADELSAGMSYVDVEVDVDVVVGNGISRPGPSIIAVSVLDQSGSPEMSCISDVVAAPDIPLSGLVNVVGDKSIEQNSYPLVMHLECAGSRMVCTGSKVWLLAAT